MVVIGTEADDDFVITADGVYGAGRFVSFIGVERVDVDGAEGNDTFSVLSTAARRRTCASSAGSGSDTINVGGDAPPVFADDLLGHSGAHQRTRREHERRPGTASTSMAWPPRSPTTTRPA